MLVINLTLQIFAANHRRLIDIEHYESVHVLGFITIESWR